MKPVIHSHGIPVHNPVNSEILRPFLKDYLDGERGCPVCGTRQHDTDDHTAGELHFSSPTTASQNKKCPACGSSWEDIYQISEALLLDAEFPVHSTVINLHKVRLDVFEFSPGQLFSVLAKPGNTQLPSSYQLGITTADGHKSIWVAKNEMGRAFVKPGDERLGYYSFSGWEVVNPTMATGFVESACPTEWGFDFGVWDKMPALLRVLEDGAGQLVIQPIDVQSNGSGEMKIKVPEIAKLRRYNASGQLLLEVALTDMGMIDSAPANSLQPRQTRKDETTMNIRGRIEVDTFPGADFAGAKFFEFENMEELGQQLREAGELLDEIDVRIEPRGALPDIIAFDMGVLTGEMMRDKVRKSKNLTLWAGRPKEGHEIEDCERDSKLIGEEFCVHVALICEPGTEDEANAS